MRIWHGLVCVLSPGLSLAFIFAPGPAQAATGCSVYGDLAGSWTDRDKIYLSPLGEDAWSGRFAAPLADHSDGPLRSFEVARDLARARPGPELIEVGGGDYYLSAPVVFTRDDAGLIIAAAPGEFPVLHGGPAVTDWREEPGGRWSAPVPLTPGQDIGSLFVEDRKQVQARYPDLPAHPTPRDGWRFAAPPAPGAEDRTNVAFSVHPGDVPVLSDTTGLEAVIVGGFNPGSQWGSDVLPVESIDYDHDIIHTQGTGYFFTGTGSRYFLQGGEALLDAPGEWWYDPQAGRLSYIPVDPGFPDRPAVAGILPTLFLLAEADDMIIAGLGFRDGAPEGSGKYGTDMRSFGALRLENAQRVQILGNSFLNLGTAIHVAESSGVLIADNDIAHTAGNGIYLGTSWGSFGRSDGAQIVDNRIRDVGEVYFETAGIWMQAADRARVAHNLIENAAQFGIAGGSLWGAQDASYQNVVEYNIVRNANQQTADGGAIKFMGAQADRQFSVIRRNLVTGTGALMNRADGSFWPPGFEDATEWPSPISWAIYLDGRASGITIAENWLEDNVAGIGINGGWSNVVRGNVITGGTGTAFRIDDSTGRGWRPDWAAANRIEDNLVGVNRSDGRVVDIYVPDHGSDFVSFAGNHYDGRLTDQSFRTNPATMGRQAFGTFGDFQRSGQDVGSAATTAAPDFFRLSGQPGAGARAHGFAIDVARFDHLGPTEGCRADPRPAEGHTHP